MSECVGISMPSPNNTIENVRWLLVPLVQMVVYATLMVMFCSVTDKALYYG